MRTPVAKILIIEDDPAIRDGLHDVFLFHGYAPDTAADGEEGLHKALHGQFDCILLDVMLPCMDGFSVCRAIRTERPHQPVIMLTAKGAEEDIVTGFKAGADDYVPKPFSLRELQVRVEAVLRRSGRLRPTEPASLGGCILDEATLTARCGDKSMALTRRELDLLHYFHAHRERIVSRKELLTEVWGYPDASIETRTVDIHLMKLRRKLEELNADLNIATVRGEGYRLLEGGRE